MSIQNFITNANWFAQNKATHPFNYTEGPERMSAIGQWPVKYPVNCDCSAFVTFCAWLAGLGDPNGQKYDHEGYTGTLLSHNTHIPVDQVQAGDIVVYGPGTGWHTAIVVDVEHGDILTVSMGEQGDPSYVWVNAPKVLPSQGHPVDGREPQTFLRLNPAVVGTVHTLS